MQTVADMRGVGVKNRGKFADVLCGRPLMLLSILFPLTSTNIFLCDRREVKIVFDIYPPLKSTHCRESPPESRVITHNYHHSE